MMLRFTMVQEDDGIDAYDLLIDARDVQAVMLGWYKETRVATLRMYGGVMYMVRDTKSTAQRRIAEARGDLIAEDD